MLKNINTFLNSSVVNFPDEVFEKKNIDLAFDELDKILDSVAMDDWKLSLTYFFIHTDHTGVAKRQRTNTSDRFYEFTLLMPIPCIDDVPYGLRKNRFPKNHHENLLRDSYICGELNFSAYHSLSELFFESAKICQSILIKKGLRTNGRVVKL